MLSDYIEFLIIKYPELNTPEIQDLIKRINLCYSDITIYSLIAIKSIINLLIYKLK
jgi:hypothetical protein